MTTFAERRLYLALEGKSLTKAELKKIAAVPSDSIIDDGVKNGYMAQPTRSTYTLTSVGNHMVKALTLGIGSK